MYPKRATKTLKKFLETCSERHLSSHNFKYCYSFKNGLMVEYLYVCQDCKVMLFVGGGQSGHMICPPQTNLEDVETYEDKKLNELVIKSIGYSEKGGNGYYYDNNFDTSCLVIQSSFKEAKEKFEKMKVLI